MQVEQEVDGAARVVILRVSGDLGDQDLLLLADRLETAADLEADFSLLVDLRQADGRTVTSVGVYALADRQLVFRSEARRAVVVPTDLGFGMARMYQMLRDARGTSMRVFRDYDTAVRWVSEGGE